MTTTKERINELKRRRLTTGLTSFEEGELIRLENKIKVNDIKLDFKALKKGCNTIGDLKKLIREAERGSFS